MRETQRRPGWAERYASVVATAVAICGLGSAPGLVTGQPADALEVFGSLFVGITAMYYDADTAMAVVGDAAGLHLFDPVARAVVRTVSIADPEPCDPLNPDWNSSIAGGTTRFHPFTCSLQPPFRCTALYVTGTVILRYEDAIRVPDHLHGKLTVSVASTPLPNRPPAGSGSQDAQAAALCTADTNCITPGCTTFVREGPCVPQMYASKCNGNRWYFLAAMNRSAFVGCSAIGQCEVKQLRHDYRPFLATATWL